jgi:carboxyl-terminal processing protease
MSPSGAGVIRTMNRTFKNVLVTASGLLVGLLLVGAVLGQNSAPQASEPYRHLNVFTEVFARIKSDYVEEPDMKNVTLGAINGLLVTVDPFASYLDASQYKAYVKAKEQKRAGLGLVLSRKYSAELSVVDAIPGSPSDQMGLSTGDIIEAINGVSTRDMPLAYADVMLEGEPGSTIELTVLRMRKPEPTTIKLTRAMVVPPAITSKMIDSQTGYVAVQDLTNGKAAEVAAKVKSLEKQGMKKLVLDLRHSAIQDAGEGAALASLFLDSGVIATLEGQKYEKETFKADPSKVVWKGDLVVLTNRGTVGAAEIAAAALQDNKRAKVVGERTYGDAAVRKTIPTGDGGALLLAVAKYKTPEGKTIQETSVTPSFAVAGNEANASLEDEDSDTPPAPAAAPKTEGAKPGEDAILKKALEVLSGKAAQVAGKSAVEITPGQPRVIDPLVTPVKQ